jgi:hypothetical protein
MVLQQLRPPTRLKLVAVGILAVPVAGLLLLAIGEMAGGDLTGAQHLVQAAPLMVLLVAGWRYPRLAGIALLGIGIILLGIWLVLVVFLAEVERAAIVAWIVGGVMLFVLPLTAGWLFLKAGRANAHAT